MLSSAKIKALKLPSSPGCYQFYNQAGVLIYVGKAVNLASRVASYWQKSADHNPMKAKMLTEITTVKWLRVETEIEALLLEANLIKKHQPYYNVLLRDDKRFAYIWVSTADAVPGVFVTRRVNLPGHYFGPFVSGTAVKETVKALRKIWPYCTTRKIAPQPCFYYQIGRCLGACGAVVTREEYQKRVIKPILAFLSGDKIGLIKQYQSRIKRWAKQIKKLSGPELERAREELERDSYLLKNLEQVLANTKVLSTAEKFATDAVELAKVLGLARVPSRIEGYDTSNIFGHEAVASLVSFQDGEADKSGYKKFKIKLGAQAKGDTDMLKEVLARRLAHAFPSSDKPGDYWPLPDLFIIDGGKAQLNLALAQLKRYQLDLPVIAIAKGGGLRSAIARDKLFIKGVAGPIELSLNSPALHLVKRVRDEAHRFAIGFHRDLRSRRLLPKRKPVSKGGLWTSD